MLSPFERSFVDGPEPPPARKQPTPKTDTPTKGRPLSSRALAFVHAYAILNNGTEAAARAGYAGSRLALGATASEILTRPRVKEELARIREMQKVAIPGPDLASLWTQDRVLREWNTLYTKCMATEAATDRKTAADILDKVGSHLGMFKAPPTSSEQLERFTLAMARLDQSREDAVALAQMAKDNSERKAFIGDTIDVRAQTRARVAGASMLSISAATPTTPPPTP